VIGQFYTESLFSVCDICWRIGLCIVIAPLGQVHTLTEKQKTKKRKPIGTRSSSRQYISLICFCPFCKFWLASAFSLSVSPSRCEPGFRLRSKFPYKCFQAFDWPIRKKNFTNRPIKNCFKAFVVLCWPYPLDVNWRSFLYLQTRWKLQKVSKFTRCWPMKLLVF